VNATNRNSYLNIIYVKLIKQVREKNFKKTKIQTFYLRILVFKNFKKPKIRTF